MAEGSRGLCGTVVEGGKEGEKSPGIPLEAKVCTVYLHSYKTASYGRSFSRLRLMGDLRARAGPRPPGLSSLAVGAAGRTISHRKSAAGRAAPLAIHSVTPHAARVMPHAARVTPHAARAIMSHAAGSADPCR